LTAFEIGLLLVRGKVPRLSVWFIDVNNPCSESSRYLEYHQRVVSGVPGIADKVKRRPEVEVLLATGDNRTLSIATIFARGLPATFSPHLYPPKKSTRCLGLYEPVSCATFGFFYRCHQLLVDQLSKKEKALLLLLYSVNRFCL
jgi:hypothetical protein